MRGRFDSTDECTRLLLRAQGGDSQAFAELYAALCPVVRNFIDAMGGRLCQDEREDLVQEVFLSMWRGLPTFRGEASAKTFALAVARRTALKAMARRQKPRVVHGGDFSGVTGPELAGSASADSREIAEVIEKAMSRLSDVQRQAIDLAKLREIPRSEAIRLANCTPNQFANRLRRAMIALRHLLRDERCGL